MKNFAGLDVSDAVPMKRELKVWVVVSQPAKAFCFRRCPYEEGTERGHAPRPLTSDPSVSDAVPMKRELKAINARQLTLRRPGFRRCPYEEGTESCHRLPIFL